MHPNSKTRSEALLAAMNSPRWLMVSLLLYAGMAAVMVRGFILEPRETFFLIMGAIFVGWAVENALKLAYPRGQLAGAALVPLVLVVVACSYLYGRDGHLGYGAVMLLGVCCFLASAHAMAAWGPAPTDATDATNR